MKGNQKMTIMSAETVVEEPVEAVKEALEPEIEKKNVSESGKTAKNGENSQKNGQNDEKEEKNIFSEENLAKTSDVSMDSDLGSRKNVDRLKLSPDDKASFIDSVVNNTRFTKEYSMFGGKLTLTLRSLTNDEVNALSSWIVKKGSNDSSGVLSGRYRKFLLAALVEMFNGTEMPPLEQPLFETLAEDGKTTVPPGWSNRADFWDGMSVGVFNAVMSCIDDFDARYSILCQKADDSNFWLPDTP